MPKNKKPSNSLTDLLAVAPQEILVDLIAELSQKRPDVRSECLNYLKKHVKLTSKQKSSTEGELVMTHWDELLPDLEELDGYGGGPEEMENTVYELMHEIMQKLNTKLVDEDVRRNLLEEVLPFIISGNAGMEDALYDLAYAACYSDEDLDRLAKAFEAMDDDWPKTHAMRIYRKLGEREKYLEMRLKKLIYGGDYYDLARFYWDEGSRSEALSVAEEGMKKGQGRMDELRQFLSDRAQEDGNRENYLKLQYELAIDHMTLDKYKEFKKICTEEEWRIYERKILNNLNRIHGSNLIDILMYRQDYKQALSELLKTGYPSWESDSILQTARKLEPRFPKQILSYYLNGFNKMSRDTTRNAYASRAKIMLNIRRVMIEVLQDETRWKQFAGQFKTENIRRPALQQEFGWIVPGWKELA